MYDQDSLSWVYYNSLDYNKLISYNLNFTNSTPPKPPIVGTETLYLGDVPYEFEYIEYKD